MPRKIRVGKSFLRGRLAFVTRQLETLVAAGIGILRSLEVTAEGEQKANQDVLHDIVVKVAQGEYLSRALAAYFEIFSPVYLAVIEIGESTSQLHHCLGMLADWTERESRTIRFVKGALSYPLLILATTLVFALGIFWWVLPSFLVLFVNSEARLPLLTRVLFWLTGAVASGWFWLVLVLQVGSLVVGLRQRWQTLEGRVQIYRVLLALPGVGGVLSTASATRYCSSLAVTLRFGVDLLKSVRLAALASGNPLIEADVDSMVFHLSEGAQLSEYYLTHPHIYPKTIGHLAEVGEESGRLHQQFQRLACWYEEQLASSLEMLTQVMEPVLLCLVSSLVGAMLLGVYLPLYGTLQTM